MPGRYKGTSSNTSNYHGVPLLNLSKLSPACQTDCLRCSEQPFAAKHFFIKRGLPRALGCWLNVISQLGIWATSSGYNQGHPHLYKKPARGTERATGCWWVSGEKRGNLKWKSITGSDSNNIITSSEALEVDIYKAGAYFKKLCIMWNIFKKHVGCSQLFYAN